MRSSDWGEKDREQGDEMDVFASLEEATKKASSYQKQSGEFQNTSASENLVQKTQNSPSVGAGCQGRPLIHLCDVRRLP